MLEAFERQSGIAVAYDAYDPAKAIVAPGAPYDVVVLPGPAVERAAAARQLRRIDKDSIPNARGVSPQVAAKLAAYDPRGLTIAWGWSATGLVYDAAKTLPLLGGPPKSWAAALNPLASAKLTSCGVALPDSRDELFMAAWRLMGANPARLRPRDVSAAADIILAARKAARVPASRDPVTAIASGAVCLTFGGAVQAAIASRRRGAETGADIRFTLPREGGPIAIDALAEPRETPHSREASALIDFLLRPEIEAEATARAGLRSAQTVDPADDFRALWPIGLYDPKIAELVEREWRRVLDEEHKKPAVRTEAKAETKAKGAEAARTERGKSKSKKANRGERKHR